MRGWHGQLKPAVTACRGLGRHGPDCAQGAFHDYWISLRGGDGTTRPQRADTSPRSVCNGRLTFVRPCWYRYFIERPLERPIDSAADIRRECRGLRPLQRAGCIGGAAVALLSDPLEQTAVCVQLASADAASCLRGVAVQSLGRQPRRQIDLLRSCHGFAAAVRTDCYRWFGRTLTLVTEGRFDCAQAGSRAGRAACRAGARKLDEPLVTFS